MKYLDPKFTVAVGGGAYAEGWERIFGKRRACSYCEHEATDHVFIENAGYVCKNPVACNARSWWGLDDGVSSDGGQFVNESSIWKDCACGRGRFVYGTRCPLCVTEAVKP